MKKNIQIHQLIQLIKNNFPILHITKHTHI